MQKVEALSPIPTTQKKKMQIEKKYIHNLMLKFLWYKVKKLRIHLQIKS